MIGSSPAFHDAKRMIERIARCDATVLIEGETGTGKELAARAIHYGGARRDGPFVPVNCGAVPDALIENELFGHCKGAYTDARTDHPGLIRLAHRGTLFLDEIDALSAKGQVTLLRFLQDQEFRPLGARAAQAGDVRIVAAANRSLDRLAQAGEFRADLLYRVKLMYVELPPLRARPGDIPLLAGHFLAAASARFGLPVRRLHADTLAWFRRYRWPGNIRELENLIFREALLADDEVLRVGPPLELVAPPEPAADPAEPAERDFNRAKARAIQEFERRFLARIMFQANGNVSAAARIVGKERRCLGKLLKKHGLDRQGFRDGM
jgi:DNA-binding NtrC family response regulator